MIDAALDPLINEGIVGALDDPSSITALLKKFAQEGTCEDELVMCIATQLHTELNSPSLC